MRVMFCYVFFFFKQKTAYEMRISDWSSDVCSSDLAWKSCGRNQIRKAGRHGADRDEIRGHVDGGHRADSHRGAARRARGGERQRSRGRRLCHGGRDRPPRQFLPRGEPRSEEHTSELQSLMRISYAVFCLKKKNNITQQQSST